MTTDVVQINVPALPPKRRGDHVHACPECYEYVPCNDVCSTEPDLTLDDGTPCGAHVTCDECVAKSVDDLAGNAVRSMLATIAALGKVAKAAEALVDEIRRDNRTDEEQEALCIAVDEWRRTQQAKDKDG